MNIKKKLQNPFVLMAQGFIGGAAIFYATMPATADVQPQSVPSTTVQSAAATEISSV